VKERLVDQEGQIVRGGVVISNRMIVLNPPHATILTPWLLMATLFIRDILKMPGHQPSRPKCLEALQQFGFGGDGLFTTISYLDAERGLAVLIAQITVLQLTGTTDYSGFRGWWRGTKARYKTQFAEHPDANAVATYFSSRLIGDAAYWERIEWAQSFPSNSPQH
jgi:hypothetical protein